MRAILSVLIILISPAVLSEKGNYSFTVSCDKNGETSKDSFNKVRGERPSTISIMDFDRMLIGSSKRACKNSNEPYRLLIMCSSVCAYEIFPIGKTEEKK